MKKLLIGGSSALSGLVLAFSMVSSVAAWHPEGQIAKSVQNISANGEVADANTIAEAVQAKAGETLRYTIEIKNVAAAANNGYNDMHYTVLRDTLPHGVEWVSDPSKREIVENLGVLKPGQKITKVYDVRLTSNQDDQIIINEACFTCDSKVKDNKQSGCDNAAVKVFVPKTSSTTTSQPNSQVEGVTTLPATGGLATIGAFAGVSGVGYAVHAAANRKRQ